MRLRAVARDVAVLVAICLVGWLAIVALIALLVYITEHGGVAVLAIAAGTMLVLVGVLLFARPSWE